jgi:hypothetical protein
MFILVPIYLLMSTRKTTEQVVRKLIQDTFAGVTLENGISLKQGEIRDNYGKDPDGQRVSDADFKRISQSEITHDWRLLTLSYLDQYAQLAHVDAKGFRYYIPAFMLSVLDSYESANPRVISTLSSLYPKPGALWEYHMQRYSLLLPGQKAAVAIYLNLLPALIDLDPADVKIAARAFNAYWKQFISNVHPLES